MKKETIEKIFNFLEEKEDKELPQKWVNLIKKIELIKEIENHPDDIQYKYEGDLHLSNTNITKLPNDLYVKGDLYLFNSKQITKLPDKLHVGGNLVLNNSNITELPDKLHVGRYLVLNNSNLTELPDDLYVGIDLCIENTPLANKYTDDEIIEMITSKGGTLIGKIDK